MEATGSRVSAGLAASLFTLQLWITFAINAGRMGCPCAHKLLLSAIPASSGLSNIVASAPLPGEDTGEVLASLGYSEDAIARLRSDEVI